MTLYVTQAVFNDAEKLLREAGPLYAMATVKASEMAKDFTTSGDQEKAEHWEAVTALLVAVELNYYSKGRIRPVNKMYYYKFDMSKATSSKASQTTSLTMKEKIEVDDFLNMVRGQSAST